MKSTKYETSNKLICDFYDKYSFLNFEEINVHIINLLSKAMDSGDIKNESNDYETIINKKLISLLGDNLQSVKNDLSIKPIDTILSAVYPTSQIKNMAGDCKIMLRENKKTIIIKEEMKKSNIEIETIDAFINNIKENECNGIFISHNSGISNKNNFQLDIVDGHIITYIHFAEYNEYKIKIAVDIIDNLNLKLSELNYNISKEILDEINNEFFFFLSQKETIINYIKETQKTLLNKISDIKFTCLDKYLSAKISNKKKEGIHKCCICHLYTSNTLKGIAAHKRGCIKKIKPISSDTN